jgi:hypothetical protein
MLRNGIPIDETVSLGDKKVNVSRTKLGNKKCFNW